MDVSVLKKVSDLVQLDLDAVSVYNEAIGHVDDEEIKARFVQFRDEHQNHVTVLTSEIERLGGKAPKVGIDLIGRVADLVTQVRSMGGTRGALHAMRTAEKVHNSRYEAATKWEIDDQKLLDTLLSFFSEEQRHLAFMESNIHVHADAAK